MSQLDDKINQHFAGLVVRKDLVKTVKGNAIVPTYVLEYLLGQYCATNDETTIQAGIDTVREILRKHYVHRNEAGLVRSTIREKGRHKVIDRISVALNDKSDAYEAEFANLGVKKVIIDAATVQTHPKLLVGGVWCIADLEYMFTEDKNVSPWILASLKPIQMSHFDFEGYLQARRQFSTEEWIDLLIQSMGFNPQLFSPRNKLNQLVRLIPFCERNYNLIELGPKGTGKSHVYSEFSPHGMLISGGEVTVPKLFVHNGTGKLGLVGYWDVVAFDEFAGKQKRVDKALVDIMKNYMANKSFSRGVETLGAEASMVFVGNTDHTVPYMLTHSDLFDPLPEKFHDSAFLDRLHGYLPGWEVDVIRGEMFSSGYGFVVDYLAEILRSLRAHDYANHYKPHFRLSSGISTRDRDGIHKTFSGLMKILFPQGAADPADLEPLLRIAIEHRKRVKDQLLRIDATYPAVRFSYFTPQETECLVTTLEEEAYPLAYRPSAPIHTETCHHADVTAAGAGSEPAAATPLPMVVHPALEVGPPSETQRLQEQQLVFHENQQGVNFELLFGPYLSGAQNITITDPCLHTLHQQRNLMELVETIARVRAPEAGTAVQVITSADQQDEAQQTGNFEKIAAACAGVGIRFSWVYQPTRINELPRIQTDQGWTIMLSRGLDVFQPFDPHEMFSFAHRLQQHRPCRAFEVRFTQSESVSTTAPDHPGNSGMN